MRVLLCSSVALAPVLGCGGNASNAPESVTINCGASDEGWLAMQDLVNDYGVAVESSADLSRLVEPEQRTSLR